MMSRLDGVIILGEDDDDSSGDEVIIDLADSDDDVQVDYETLVYEESERRDKEAAASAKMQRQKVLQSYGSHQWCERRAEAEAWLRLFVNDQVCSDGGSWTKFYGTARPPVSEFDHCFGASHRMNRINLSMKSYVHRPTPVFHALRNISRPRKRSLSFCGATVPMAMIKTMRLLG